MIVNALKTGFIEGDGHYYKQPRIEIRPWPQIHSTGDLRRRVETRILIYAAANLVAPW